MNWNASTIENLRRVFTQGFAARDIAEPLVSFDACTPAVEARRLMIAENFDVVGVRRDGLVVGYAEREDLGAGTCGDHLRAFEAESLIADTAGLADVVLGLARFPRLFVRILGAVSGIVTISDAQKAPVRMWLFGMVTLLEMRISRLIELTCPGDTWKEFLSEGRLQKAQALLEERKRRNQNLELLDCLQISDKGQIIARNEELRRLTRSESRRQTEEIIKMLESLRNNLAHSQDIIASDWQTIVGMCGDLERMIAGTEEVQQALEKRTNMAPKVSDEGARP